MNFIKIFEFKDSSIIICSFLQIESLYPVKKTQFSLHNISLTLSRARVGRQLLIILRPMVEKERERN